jgi:hypothetical protein
MPSRLNFVRQQGLKDATPQTCAYLYPSLMWQPRAILVLVVLGLLVETGWYFVALGAVLWWNALVPNLSLFDAVYNRLIARRRGTPLLAPALAPRRTAQAIAGTLSLVIGMATIMHRQALAWALFGVLFAAVMLLAMGRFCLGSTMYWLFTGQFSFARRTMPWSRGE